MCISFVVAVALLLAGASRIADAQPSGKVAPRIGYLEGAPLSAVSVRVEAFRQGLRELGYVEGHDIAIEWRSAEGEADRLPRLAAELVRLEVDVIVTGGAGATRPARAATATISFRRYTESENTWRPGG